MKIESMKSWIIGMNIFNLTDYFSTLFFFRFPNMKEQNPIINYFLVNDLLLELFLLKTSFVLIFSLALYSSWYRTIKSKPNTFNCGMHKGIEIAVTISTFMLAFVSVANVVLCYV